MTILVTCDCGKNYRVSDDKAGRRFKCRECGTLLQVPNANEEVSDSENSDAEELEMEQDAEYVPAHHRAAATSRSAKKNARRKKAVSARNRWLLIGGGTVASVALIVGGFAWANAHLRPEQKNLLWFTVAVPAFFVLFDQLHRYSIRSTLHSYGETIQSISWRPFKNFFNLNGGWPPHLYFYEVRYIDRYGNARSGDVAFIRHRGMVWDDDI